MTDLYSLLAKTQLGVVLSPFALSTVSSCTPLEPTLGLYSEGRRIKESSCTPGLAVKPRREHNEEAEEDREGGDCDSIRGENTAGGKLGDCESRRRSMGTREFCIAKLGRDDSRLYADVVWGGISGKLCCEESMN